MPKAKRKGLRRPTTSSPGVRVTRTRAPATLDRVAPSPDDPNWLEALADKVAEKLRPTHTPPMERLLLLSQARRCWPPLLLRRSQVRRRRWLPPLHWSMTPLVTSLVSRLPVRRLGLLPRLYRLHLALTSRRRSEHKFGVASMWPCLT
jgi:hypothetical protein